MPRSIEATLDPAHTGAVTARLRELPGVSGLSLQPAASLLPPGDRLSVQSSNAASAQVLSEIARLAPGASMTVSEVSAAVVPGQQARLDREDGEGSFEELGRLLRDYASPTLSFHLLMLGSGLLVGVGFWINFLPMILGGQLFGPHVEPLLRLPLGVVTGRREHLRRGALAFLTGYACLFAGTLLAYALMRLADPAVSADLHTRTLARSYAPLSVQSALVEAVAALAAALILSSRRTLLMSGVYVALALVPAWSLIALALAGGQPDVARHALVHWAYDVLAVVVLGGGALTLKRALFERRRPLA